MRRYLSVVVLGTFLNIRTYGARRDVRAFAGTKGRRKAAVVDNGLRYGEHKGTHKARW